MKYYQRMTLKLSTEQVAHTLMLTLYHDVPAMTVVVIVIIEKKCESHYCETADDNIFIDIKGNNSEKLSKSSQKKK